jgi:hypothetical protein
VTDALDSYSRVLARNLMATEETYLYLPEQMRNQKFTSPLEKLRQENKRYFLSEIIQILKISKPSRKTLSLLLEFLNSNAITYTDDIGAHDIRGNSSKTLASKNSFANSNKITKMTQLDQKKIKNLEEETRLIQDTLAQEIFVEDFPKISENVPGSKPKLSAKSNELFNHIIQREEWTMEELGEFAKNRQIMLDGALEEINDNFTETFIEIFGDMVYVNLNLIKETNN